MKFAKLIDLENNQQVLVTLQITDEKIEANIRTDFEDFSVNVNSSFKTEKEAEDFLKMYDMNLACKFREEMWNMVGEG